MKAGALGIKRLWMSAFAASLIVLAAVAALFRAPNTPPPRPPAGLKPTLSLGPVRGGPSGPGFSDDAALHDPTPLFLPTRWNSMQKEAPHRGSDIAFAGYEPKFAFRETELKLGLPPYVAVPPTAAEALVVNPPGHPFLAMGRIDAIVPPLSSRSAFIEIVAFGSGRRMLEQPLMDLPPKVADAPPDGGAWQFMAAVDAAGLVGPLVQTVRSGTATDRFFLTYLTQSLQLGARLPPGLYRISIGP